MGMRGRLHLQHCRGPPQFVRLQSRGERSSVYPHMGDESQRWLPRFLIDCGYRCFVRRNGWIECLISNDQERWIGRGGDEMDAVRDALAQMFPAAAARRRR